MTRPLISYVCDTDEAFDSLRSSGCGISPETFYEIEESGLVFWSPDGVGCLVFDDLESAVYECGTVEQWAGLGLTGTGYAAHCTRMAATA